MDRHPPRSSERSEWSECSRKPFGNIQMKHQSSHFLITRMMPKRKAASGATQRSPAKSCTWMKGLLSNEKKKRAGFSNSLLFGDPMQYTNLTKGKSEMQQKHKERKGRKRRKKISLNAQRDTKMVIKRSGVEKKHILVQPTQKEVFSNLAFFSFVLHSQFLFLLQSPNHIFWKSITF